MDHPKFAAFSVTKTPYKVVNGHEIDAFVSIPKDVHSGKRPVLIHIHGGFLVTGDAVYHEWTDQWLLDYQTLHSAIRISPNYRFLPESNGVEILSDIFDFFNWVQNDLPAHLKSIGSAVEPDLEHLLVYGESAGGYLALQSALVKRNEVKAVISAYPMVYLDSPWYAVASDDKSPFGVPQLPKDLLDNFLKSVEKGTVVSSMEPPNRIPVALCMLQNGRFPEFLGKEDKIYLDKVLDGVKAEEKVPALFAFHGLQDTAVPYEQTKQFIKSWKGKFGEDSAIEKYEEGDHGFDGPATLETEWLKEGLEVVTKAWLY